MPDKQLASFILASQVELGCKPLRLGSCTGILAATLCASRRTQNPCGGLAVELGLHRVPDFGELPMSTGGLKLRCRTQASPCKRTSPLQREEQESRVKGSRNVTHNSREPLRTLVAHTFHSNSGL